MLLGGHKVTPSGRELMTILLGGDTDTHAAIGVWCGALHGEAALPAALVILMSPMT